MEMSRLSVFQIQLMLLGRSMGNYSINQLCISIANIASGGCLKLEWKTPLYNGGTQQLPRQDLAEADLDVQPG